ncbi:metalloregulator ArsR/SmtB family transcription factor [Archaeoglobus sp.]
MIDLFTSTRVQILSKLIERPYTASEIAKITGYSKTTVSYHLSKLSEAGLVERHERGKWVYYRITPKGERRVKVEAAVSLASLVGAVISAVVFAALKLLSAAEKPLIVAEKAVTPHAITPYAPTTEAAGSAFDLQLVFLIVAVVLACVFVYLRFRK